MKTESSIEEDHSQEKQVKRPNTAIQKPSQQKIEYLQSEYKVKQLKSQLYYMLNENDNLREELHSVKMSQTTRTKAETDEMLQIELVQVKQERDEALKNLLLTRQLSQYFKHREEVQDQALIDKIWEQDQVIQAKDNIIQRLNAQVDDLKKGKNVVEKYVVQPNLIIMQLESKTKQLELQIKQKNRELDQMKETVNEKILREKVLMVQSQHSQKLIEIANQQVSKLRQQLAQMTTTQSKTSDSTQIKEIQKLLQESQQNQQRQIEMVLQSQLKQTQELESKLNLMQQATQHPQHQTKPAVAQNSTAYEQTKQEKPKLSDRDESESSNQQIFTQKAEETQSHIRHKSIVPQLDLSGVIMGSGRPVAKVDLFNVKQHQAFSQPQAQQPKIQSHTSKELTNDNNHLQAVLNLSNAPTVIQKQIKTIEPLQSQIQTTQSAINKQNQQEQVPVQNLLQPDSSTETDQGEYQPQIKLQQPIDIPSQAGSNLEEVELEESEEEESDRTKAVTQQEKNDFNKVGIFNKEKTTFGQANIVKGKEKDVVADVNMPQTFRSEESDEDDPFVKIKKINAGQLPIQKDIAVSSQTQSQDAMTVKSKNSQNASNEIQVKSILNSVTNSIHQKIIEIENKSIDVSINQQIKGQLQTQIKNSQHSIQQQQSSQNNIEHKNTQNFAQDIKSDFDEQETEVGDQLMPSRSQQNKLNFPTVKQVSRNETVVGAPPLKNFQSHQQNINSSKDLSIKQSAGSTIQLNQTISPSPQPSLTYQQTTLGITKQQQQQNPSNNVNQNITQPKQQATQSNIRLDQQVVTTNQSQIQNKNKQKQLEVQPIKVENIESKSNQEDEEYYEEESEQSVSVKGQNLDSLKKDELRKLRLLLRQNKSIPKVVIIKDAQGTEFEYEVIEESEDGESGPSSLSLRAISNNDDNLEEESAEYYEEVIEESEEETNSRMSQSDKLNQ